MNPRIVNTSSDKRIGRTIGKISIETMFMERECSHGKGAR